MKAVYWLVCSLRRREHQNSPLLPDNSSSTSHSQEPTTSSNMNSLLLPDNSSSTSHSQEPTTSSNMYSLLLPDNSSSTSHSQEPTTSSNMNSLLLPDNSSSTSHSQEPTTSSNMVEEFQDAVEMQTTQMDLHNALNDCCIAVNNFFNNDIIGAIKIMTPWKHHSLYHAHGAAIFEFIPAMLTLDPDQIKLAQEAIDHTIDLYNRTRYPFTFAQTLSAFIKKPNYMMYSDLQAHAELINAECQLIAACLGAIECEDMSGLIRVSIRIKSSFSSYKHCAKLLDRKHWENDLSRWHFSSGVKLGVATFNVMVAMLPPKIITLLEFVGFTANKEYGLAELLDASDLPGLRSVLCRMTFLAYHLVIGHFACIRPDMKVAEKVLRTSLAAYPNSAWFLLFKGRMELLSGLIQESTFTYNAVCDTHDLWDQIKHLAYWETMWAKAMMMEWRDAARYAGELVQQSKWSTTIYMYVQASLFMELNDLTYQEIIKTTGLIVSAPIHKQRIMGRSIPMEKFVSRRCARWIDRGHLVLPGVEMLCLWNYFPALAANPHYSDKLLQLIERTFDRIEITTTSTYKRQPDDKEYDIEDRALVRFLRGSLLAAMHLPRLAIRHLDAVVKVKDQIKDSYLVPYSIVEAAMCHYELGDRSLAMSLLHDARRKYSGYNLESRLNFRIHAKLHQIRTA